MEFRTTELPAILQLAANLLHETPAGSTLVFRSRPNTFRNAFEKGWIIGWIADGFKTKPREHREEWAHLHKMKIERGISIRVDDLTKAVEERLEQALGLRAVPLRSAPGDPIEEPWG
jgi:hypothetical protein